MYSEYIRRNIVKLYDTFKIIFLKLQIFISISNDLFFSLGIIRKIRIPYETNFQIKN